MRHPLTIMTPIYTPPERSDPWARVLLVASLVLAGVVIALVTLT